MWKNYLRTAWRNITNNKVYSGINIAGLSIGLAAFFIIATVVINDYSYDTQWSKGDRIFRLITKNENLGDKRISTPSPLGPLLLKDFDQVENFTRISQSETNFKFEKDPVELNTLGVNPGIWDILDLKTIQGTPRKYIDGYPNLIITKSVKEKYFANSNPVGKIVKDFSSYGAPTEYYISGVIEDLPVNTHLRSDVLVITKPRDIKFDSNFIPYSTQYLLLKPGVSAKDFTAAMNQWYKNIPAAQEKTKFSLQSMKAIYLNSDDYFQKIKGNKRNINILTGVALLLLLIACINFINLSTARTLKKIKNTGLRKVLGASKKNLIAQFLTESFLFFGISYMLALLMYAMLLPLVESFLGNQISLTLTGSYQLLGISFSVLVIMSLLTGIYPAWIISKPKASNIISNTFRIDRNSEFFRKGLVVMQFVITIAVIVATLVINNQLKFLDNKDLGFNKANLLFISFTSWGDNGSAFEKEISKIPGVKTASIGQWVPSSGGTFSREVDDPQAPGTKLKTWYIDADKNLFATLEMKLIKGRNFRNEFSANKIISFEASPEEEQISELKPVLITEYTAERLGIDELNRPYDAIQGIPIGIIKNFHNQNLRNPLAPTIIRSVKHPEFGNMLVRIDTDKPETAVMAIGKMYEKMFPENLFDYTWVSDYINKEYKAERKLLEVLEIFSILIVFLSCLGLFGLITFIVQNRTKEISIRKVLGASVAQIVNIFSKDSLKLILIASVIAFPIAGYLINKWLEDFPYRVKLGPGVFIESLLVVLIIALATIGVRIVRAAFQNPADNLRSE